MVRTQGVGFIRDPRRIIVAFSRARYGLYVLGNYYNFAHFSEYQSIFN
jgi:intron-binding protein aquarius